MKSCPKCEAPVLYVNLEAVPVHEAGKAKWKGVSFCCPSCSSVLGVQIDPHALGNDLLQDILEGLRSKK